MLTLLVVSTLAAFAATLATLALAPERALTALHLVFAAGALPLILGAMGFFVPVLTRSAAVTPAVRALPLAALAGGWLAVLGFAQPTLLPALHPLAALLAALAAAGMAVWMARRGARALGGAHPGLGWYLAALVCLLIALAAVLAMPLFPEQRLALRRLHLHLNTFGFVALTAVGTLQVLLPTVAGRPDPQAGLRLRQDLKWAVSGALLVAAGAVGPAALAWAGLACWLIVLARLAVAWLQGFRREIFALHHAAASLGAALAGLLLLFAAGGLHAAKLLTAANAAPAFVFAFLLPLVSGALSHLLPLWLWPQAPTRMQEAARRQLARYSGVHAVLFLAAGVSLLLGEGAGLALAIAGLALFVLQVGRALAAHRAAQ